MSLTGIIANTRIQLAGDGVKSLAKWLEARGLDYIMDRDTARSAGMESEHTRMDVAGQAELIVVLGGDGTIIGVARLIEGRKVPLLGVNLGALGFLTEFAYEEMFPALELVLDGKYKYEDRIMLEASITHGGKPGAPHTALNDVVVHRGAMSQMVDMNVEADGVLLNNYSADGLIIATPTGSTAYNLSSGGPIVYPSLNAVIISPISPHTLSNRPVVLPDSVEITIAIANNSGKEAVATLDGQVGFQLNSYDAITIRKSKEVTRIIQSPFKDYYELLRGKLKWGETIRESADRK